MKKILRFSVFVILLYFVSTLISKGISQFYEENNTNKFEENIAEIIKDKKSLGNLTSIKLVESGFLKEQKTIAFIYKIPSENENFINNYKLKSRKNNIEIYRNSKHKEFLKNNMINLLFQFRNINGDLMTEYRIVPNEI